jgi:hypothetical protein
LDKAVRAEATGSALGLFAMEEGDYIENLSPSAAVKDALVK